MNNEAVIVLDMLNDFLTGELKCERPMRIIPNVKRLVASAHKHKVPVVYSNDAHLPIDEEVVERWGKHAMKGTKGAEVIPELRPLKKDYSVEKRTYSAFHETGLDMFLRRLYHGAGARTVIMTGVHTTYVLDTRPPMHSSGAKITVARDGVEAFTQEDRQQGLKYLKKNFPTQRF